MEHGQQSQYHRTNGFVADGMVGMNRPSPQVEQRGRGMDFPANGQQRFWQQDFVGQYDAYRAPLPAQSTPPVPTQPTQQPLGVFPHVNGGLPVAGASARGGPMHPYVPGRGPIHQRFDDQQYQSLPEEFDIMPPNHAPHPTAPQGIPKQVHQPAGAPPQAAHHTMPQIAHRMHQGMVPQQPVMVKNLPHISPAPQRRKIDQPNEARKVQRVSLAQDSPHASEAPLEESDNDLKRIAMDSLRYPIERAVAHVKEDDNSPLAEKSRQVFGMSWLLRSCESKPEANVPRNRIYAHYVASCDEFKLKPLNHATFGKLVRIIFPNIKTRRLGVRGHSKYHYCGVALLDSISPLTRTPSPSMTPRSNSLMDSFSPSSIQTESPPVNNSVASISQASVSTPIKPVLSGMTSTPPESNRPFAEELWTVLRGRESQLSIPQLGDYLTSEADGDNVATLYGLYKSQCRALIPLIKNLQFKNFLNQFASFLSSLTVPVQRLLQRQDTLTWVVECDKLLLDEVVCVLSALTLKNLGHELQQGLHLLSVGLVSCVEQGRKVMPEHYFLIKKQMVERVVVIVNGMLSASYSSENLMKIYMNPGDLQAMKSDWARLVTTQSAQDAPCNPELAGMILTEEIPRLLDTDGAQDALWYSMQFLSYLRDRFPTASTQLFLLGVSAIVTNALKEINRGSGPSFGCWWMYRTWVDDWLGWVAKMVDFLHLNSDQFGDVKAAVKQE